MLIVGGIHLKKYYKILFVSLLLVVLVLFNGCNKSGYYFSGECDEFSVGRGEITISRNGALYSSEGGVYTGEGSGLFEFGYLNVKSGNFDNIKKWGFGFGIEGEDPFYWNTFYTDDTDPLRLPYYLGSTDDYGHGMIVIQNDNLYFRLEVEDFDGNKEVYNVPMKLHK